LKIYYLPYQKIDAESWDKCIDLSVNGCIFGYTWYLNQVSPGWSAVINEDYSAVMPLPVNVKYGTHYILTPYFIHHLGIFSQLPLSNEIVLKFISAIPAEIKYFELYFNKLSIIPPNIFNEYGSKSEVSKHTKKLSSLIKETSLNEFFDLKPEIEVSVYRTAFELDLIRNYQYIFTKYSQELKQKLTYCKSLNFNIIGGVHLQELIDLYLKNERYSGLKLSKNKLKKLQSIVSYCINSGAGEITGAYDNENKLCTAALFISSHNKTFMVFNAQNKLSRKNFVLEHLIDSYIRKHSEKNITLCLYNCGKNLINYDGFGAQRCTYPALMINKFKGLMKPLHLLFKKHDNS
jgi:hypothetical protein